MHGARHVEPDGEGLPGGYPRRPLGVGEVAAGSGIERSVGAVGRMAGAGDFLLDLLAGAEAGICHAQSRQPVQRRAVVVQMLRLAADRGGPCEAQPGQVLHQLPLELRPAAAGIDILDPQQEKPVPVARGGPAEQGGMGVAEVKEAGRAGGEAGDGLHVGIVQVIRYRWADSVNARIRRCAIDRRFGNSQNRAHERTCQTDWTQGPARLRWPRAPTGRPASRSRRRWRRPDLAGGLLERASARCGVRFSERAGPVRHVALWVPVVQPARPLHGGHDRGRQEGRSRHQRLSSTTPWPSAA